jgi:hypothetical protein
MTLRSCTVDTLVRLYVVIIIVDLTLYFCWVDRFCLQYFLPAAKKGINQQIELAILRADRMGVKVLSLAALNKVSSHYPLLHCTSNTQ